MRVGQITVEQARAIQAFSPAAWTITQTPEGWVVHRGESELVSFGTRKRRLFASPDTAIRRMRIEVGITEFKVQALPTNEGEQPAKQGKKERGLSM